MQKLKPSFRMVLSIPHELYELVIGQCCLLGMEGNEESTAGDRIVLTPYFGDEETARTAEGELRKIDGLEISSIEPVEQRDWLAKWRESMQPARLADGFWVSPTWLTPPDSAKHWIKIEPKMAFGTGHHETTRLAAAAIIDCAGSLPGRRLLDIGTGSGVLCFTADTCGAASCLGVEIDAQCRENLAENRRDNPAEGRVDFCIGSIDALGVRGCFDFVVMNMLITESAPLLTQVAGLLTPEGSLIWSGILVDEAKEAVDRAGTAGFSLADERCENEWWCGVFKKN